MKKSLIVLAVLLLFAIPLLIGANDRPSPYFTEEGENRLELLLVEMKLVNEQLAVLWIYAEAITSEVTSMNASWQEFYKDIEWDVPWFGVWFEEILDALRNIERALEPVGD